MKLRRQDRVYDNRAVAYIRVSTGRQELSVDAQEERIKVWCKANNVEIVATCKDIGASGGNLNRPGFQEAKAILDRGDASVLVFAKFDRVSRSQADFAGLLRHAQDKGWSMASVGEQFDTGTPIGKAMVSIIMTFAELEREVTVDRTNEVFDQLRKDGKKCSGTMSSGMLLVDGRVVPNEEMLAFVRDLYLDLGYGSRRIATALNEAGFRTTAGKEFTPNRVDSLLHTYRAYGLLKPPER